VVRCLSSQRTNTTITMNALMLLTLAASACTADPNKADTVTISEAKKDANGFLIHEVRSPYEAGITQIRVLVGDKLDPAKRYPVVFILPVEAGTENKFGDGLMEIKKQDLHNNLPAIFVAPTFSHLPWYADHPTNSEIRQETYFLKVVVPFIEKTYPVQAEASGRLLLGFSKSGCGAFSLLLRHLDVFGKAAAWDAPLMMTRPDRFGMGDIFGTQDNFEKYQTAKLLEAQAGKLQKEERLLLMGYGNFRDHHEKAHALMSGLKIAHEYRDGPARKHDWHSGWVVEASEWLIVGHKK
jgi:S-formylglutathione hydrolase FrmB